MSCKNLARGFGVAKVWGRYEKREESGAEKKRKYREMQGNQNLKKHLTPGS